jgi:hypothetical protein
MYKKIAESVDPDPNDHHHQLVKTFINYVNSYERFSAMPSSRTRRACAKRLREMRNLTKLVNIDLVDVYDKFLKDCKQYTEEKKSKKASKGK